MRKKLSHVMLVIEDEIHAGRKAVALSFELGKGNYATIMVKRITAGASMS